MYFDTSIISRFRAMPLRDKQDIYKFATLCSIEDMAKEIGKEPSDDEYSDLLELSHRAWISIDGPAGIDRFSDAIADSYFTGRKTLSELENMSKTELLEFVENYDFEVFDEYCSNGKEA